MLGHTEINTKIEIAFGSLELGSMDQLVAGVGVGDVSSSMFTRWSWELQCWWLRLSGTNSAVADGLLPCSEKQRIGFGLSGNRSVVAVWWCWWL